MCHGDGFKGFAGQYYFFEDWCNMVSVWSLGGLSLSSLFNTYMLTGCHCQSSMGSYKIVE